MIPQTIKKNNKIFLVAKSQEHDFNIGRTKKVPFGNELSLSDCFQDKRLFLSCKECAKVAPTYEVIFY